MKLQIASLIVLIAVGCERKDTAPPDAGPTTTGGVEADAGAASDAKPYFHTKHLDAAGQPKFRNEVAGSANAWLGRHGHQPTKWMSWSSQPLVVSRSQAKPVLLFVGDLDCSPCVARGEAFDDPVVAKVANEKYVPAIVDADERPDIAQFARESVAALGGRGPAVIVVAMTGEGHVARDFGEAADPAALATALAAFADEYGAKRAAIDVAAKEASAKVRKRQLDLAGKAAAPKPLLDAALSALHQSYDPGNPGWPRDGAKAPSAEQVRVALRASRWAEEKDATLAMATQTLDKMTEALADERGYWTASADPAWKFDHKVKSLAENAALLRAYTEAWQLTQAERYEKAARNIAGFLLGDMQAADGGFYARAILRPDGETVYDTRMLAGPNGAAISALARAGWVFDEVSWVTAAVNATAALPTVSGKLVHHKGAKLAYASDFSATIDGLLSAFEATSDSAHLRRAVLLQNQLDVMYRDPESGGYFEAPTELVAELPVRMKLFGDAGLPSANSLAMVNALRLEAFRDDKEMVTRRDELRKAFGAVMQSDPLSSPTALIALDWLAGDRKRVTVVGAERKAMLDILRHNFMPHVVYATVSKNSAVPWLAGKEARASKATGFICRAECSDPITEPAEFEKALQSL